MHFGIVQNATVQIRLYRVYGNEALFVRAWFKQLGSPELDSAGTFPPKLEDRFSDSPMIGLFRMQAEEMWDVVGEYAHRS